MDYIIKLIETLPLFWKIVMISIIVFGNLGYLFRKQIFKLFKKKDESNLKDHKIFSESSYLKQKIRRISLEDGKKSHLFQQLLTIKLDAIIKHSELLIDTPDIETYSNNQFYALIIKNMTTIIEEYNEKIKFKFGEKIYNLVMMDSEKGFNFIHEKTVTFIKSTVEETFESEHVIFITIHDKIDFLLDLYYIAMKIALTDVDKVYKNFNGDLTDLIKKCKSCDL